MTIETIRELPVLSLWRDDWIGSRFEEEDAHHILFVMTDEVSKKEIILKSEGRDGSDAEYFSGAAIRRKDGTVPASNPLVYRHAFSLGWLKFDPKVVAFVRECVAEGVEIEDRLLDMINRIPLQKHAFDI